MVWEVLVTYLQQAYEIALNNVNKLVDEQITLNNQYLNPVEKKKKEKGATKQQNKDIDNYNDMLTEKRKTELPPISEPLTLNCSLLFSLAKELDIDIQEQKKIENILHGDSETLFYVKPIEDAFSFAKPSSYSVSASIGDGKLVIPAEYLSEDYIIDVEAVTDGEVTKFDDLALENVDRGEKGKINIGSLQLGDKRNPEGDFSKFDAVFSSNLLKSYRCNKNTKIVVNIKVSNVENVPNLHLQFQAVKGSLWGFLWFIPTYSYELVESNSVQFETENGLMEQSA